ncbi:hypothetical protein ACP70R_004387 [Stipagrostis hirtigluma subsp. patula]
MKERTKVVFEVHRNCSTSSSVSSSFGGPSLFSLPLISAPSPGTIAAALLSVPVPAVVC